MVKILIKQVSAPNFKLKGSGWYETDFKNKNDAKDSKKNDTTKKLITKKAEKPNA